VRKVRFNNGVAWSVVDTFKGDRDDGRGKETTSDVVVNQSREVAGVLVSAGQRGRVRAKNPQNNPKTVNPREGIQEGHGPPN